MTRPVGAREIDRVGRQEVRDGLEAQLDVADLRPSPPGSYSSSRNAFSMCSSRMPAGRAQAPERVARARRGDQPRARRVGGARPAVDRHRLVARRVGERRRERHEVEDVVGVQVRDHDRVDVRVVARRRAASRTRRSRSRAAGRSSPLATRYPLHAPPASCQAGDLPSTLSSTVVSSHGDRRERAARRLAASPLSRRATGESPIAETIRRAARLAPAQSGTARPPDGGAPGGTRTASGCGGRRPFRVLGRNVAHG